MTGTEYKNDNMSFFFTVFHKKTCQLVNYDNISYKVFINIFSFLLPER